MIAVSFWTGSSALAFYNLQYSYGEFDFGTLLSIGWVVALLMIAPRVLPAFVDDFFRSLSNERFAAIRRVDGLEHLGVGYRLLGRVRWSETIPADAITRVYVSAGQASGLAREDMDDWTTVVEYELDVRRLCVIGPGQPRELAQEDCDKLAALLAESAEESARRDVIQCGLATQREAS